MRRRGKDAGELRVYQGIDPDTRRQRWLMKTVHGTQRFAHRALEDRDGNGWRRHVNATLVEALYRRSRMASSTTVAVR
jgi:hypothetical protein